MRFSQASPAKGGVTLIELLIACSLLVLAGVLVSRALEVGLRAYRLQSQQLDKVRREAMFQARVQADLQVSSFLGGLPPNAPTQAVGGSRLRLRKNNGTATPTDVEYELDPVNHRVVRRQDGDEQVVLFEVEQFRYWQGSPALKNFLVETQLTGLQPHLVEVHLVDIGW